MRSLTRTLRRLTHDSAVIVLAFTSVFLLTLEVVFQLSPANQSLINSLDLLICGVFLADYIHHYQHARRKSEFVKEHWWEPLALIPLITPLTHLFSLSSLPLLALVRLIRLGVRLRLVVLASFHYTRHPYLIYIVTLVASVVFAGAAGFYYFEQGINPNVHNYWDGVWWAIVTTATIGYGDVYPVTLGGRIVAIVVMFVGIASLGTFIATVESLLVKNNFKRVSAKKPRR